MNELLKTLHDRFYFPTISEEGEEEIEDCYRQLKEMLGKPERKLLLRILDAKDRIVDDTSLDSFICGFRLALELSNELHYLECLYPLQIGHRPYSESSPVVND